MRQTNATVYHVAKRAGVSIATVSRVINDAAGVRPETRQRVLDAIAEYGYVPNASAQGLGRRSTAIIGLVYRRRALGQPSPTGYDPEREQVVEQTHQSLIYYDQLIRGVEDAAARYGYVLLLASTRTDTDAAQIMALSAKVDALVLADRVMPDADISALTRRVPVASISHPINDDGVSNVMVDNDRSMRTLLDHLVDTHGIRRAAMMGGPIDNADSIARVTAVVSHAAKRGVELLPLDDWRGDFSPDVAFDIVRRNWAAGGPLPETIIGVNDGTATGALAALRSLGVDVPGEVTVTGFDDVELARLTTPGLTTIRQPVHEITRVAVAAVVRAASGGARHQPMQTVAGELVVRGSCGCRETIGGLSTNRTPTRRALVEEHVH